MQITININLEEVLNRVYAESAWRTAHDKDAYTLTPDNKPLIAQMVHKGLVELLARTAGYVSDWNYNADLAENNISITLTVSPQINVNILEGDIIEALAFNALMQFYGRVETYYTTAWLKYRSHVVLLLCERQF